MSSKAHRLKKLQWLIYLRSFLLTLGLFFLILSFRLIILEKSNVIMSEWGLLVFVVFLFFLGAIAISISIFSSNKQVEKWANMASGVPSIVIIIIMAIAFPVYCFWFSLCKGKNRGA
jgi:uncharacterized membrane protein HdeD (DUF308 family)